MTDLIKGLDKLQILTIIDNKTDKHNMTVKKQKIMALRSLQMTIHLIKVKVEMRVQVRLTQQML